MLKCGHAPLRNARARFAGLSCRKSQKRENEGYEI